MAPELGPVEIIVVDFDGNHFNGEILPELERLKENDIVRLVDLLVVRKDKLGGVLIATATDLGIEEMLAFGAKIGAIVASTRSGYDEELDGALDGLQLAATGHVFDEAEARKLAESLPNGFASAVVILEHRWAIPFRGAIARANGKIISQEWISEDRLVDLALEHTRNGN
jgi:uncharacterized membrane protein